MPPQHAPCHCLRPQCPLGLLRSCPPDVQKGPRATALKGADHLTQPCPQGARTQWGPSRGHLPGSFGPLRVPGMQSSAQPRRSPLTWGPHSLRTGQSLIPQGVLPEARFHETASWDPWKEIGPWTPSNKNQDACNTLISPGPSDF